MEKGQREEEKKSGETWEQKRKNRVGKRHYDRGKKEEIDKNKRKRKGKEEEGGGERTRN